MEGTTESRFLMCALIFMTCLFFSGQPVPQVITPTPPPPSNTVSSSSSSFSPFVPIRNDGTEEEAIDYLTRTKTKPTISDNYLTRKNTNRKNKKKMEENNKQDQDYVPLFLSACMNLFIEDDRYKCFDIFAQRSKPFSPFFQAFESFKQCLRNPDCDEALTALWLEQDFASDQTKEGVEQAHYSNNNNNNELFLLV